MSMRHTLGATVVAMAAAFAGNAAAGDAANGEKLFETCEGCHAIPGYYNVYPSFHVPKVAGQKAMYIVSALKAYKDGQRPHETMRSQAASLSDSDMADIAAYLEGLSGQ